MKLSVLILNKETEDMLFRKEGSDIATMNSKIVITIIAHPLQTFDVPNLNTIPPARQYGCRVDRNLLGFPKLLFFRYKNRGYHS